MNERKRETDTIISWAVYGSVATGVLAVAGSVLSFLGGQYTASATFLVAAALAFGLLSSALLRS